MEIAAQTQQSLLSGLIWNACCALTSSWNGMPSRCLRTCIARS